MNNEAFETHKPRSDRQPNRGSSYTGVLEEYFNHFGSGMATDKGRGLLNL